MYIRYICDYLQIFSHNRLEFCKYDIDINKVRHMDDLPDTPEIMMHFIKIVYFTTKESNIIQIFKDV